MNYKKIVSSLVNKQKVNLKNLYSYKKLYLTHHSSRTLERDDVALANKWLKKKKDWFCPDVVKDFETRFARWNESNHALAYMSGREALSAGIYGLDLTKGDEVIIPAYTCIVVPNAFIYKGIKVKYVDIELETFGIDKNSLEQKISSKTKAILLHHLYGNVCRDFEEILKIADKNDLKVIEDCAHATGAIFKGRKVGNFGDVAFYSSEQSKVFNTVQGGMVSTNDQKIYSRLTDHYQKANLPNQEWIKRQLLTLKLFYYRYQSPHRWLLEPIYRHRLESYKLTSTTEEELEQNKPLYYGRKMAAPIAAIGINQLQKVDQFNKMRREKALEWNHWCCKNEYTSPTVIEEAEPVWLRYPVLMESEKKKDSQWAKKELGIKLGVWFKSYLHPSNVNIKGTFPNAKKAVKQCVNFPTL